MAGYFSDDLKNNTQADRFGLPVSARGAIGQQALLRSSAGGRAANGAAPADFSQYVNNALAGIGQQQDELLEAMKQRRALNAQNMQEAAAARAAAQQESAMRRGERLAITSELIGAADAANTQRNANMMAQYRRQRDAFTKMVEEMETAEAAARRNNTKTTSPASPILAGGGRMAYSDWLDEKGNSTGGKMVLPEYADAPDYSDSLIASSSSAYSEIFTTPMEQDILGLIERRRQGGYTGITSHGTSEAGIAQDVVDEVLRNTDKYIELYGEDMVNVVLVSYDAESKAAMFGRDMVPALVQLENLKYDYIRNNGNVDMDAFSQNWNFWSGELDNEVAYAGGIVEQIAQNDFLLDAGVLYAFENDEEMAAMFVYQDTDEDRMREWMGLAPAALNEAALDEIAKTVEGFEKPAKWDNDSVVGMLATKNWQDTEDQYYNDAIGELEKKHPDASEADLKLWAEDETFIYMHTEFLKNSFDSEEEYNAHVMRVESLIELGMQIYIDTDPIAQEAGISAAEYAKGGLADISLAQAVELAMQQEKDFEIVQVLDENDPASRNTVVQMFGDDYHIETLEIDSDPVDLEATNGEDEGGYSFHGVARWNTATGYLTYMADSVGMEINIDNINQVIAQESLKAANGETLDDAAMKELRSYGLDAIIENIQSIEPGDKIIIPKEYWDPVVAQRVGDAVSEQTDRHKMYTRQEMEEQAMADEDFVLTAAQASNVFAMYSVYSGPQSNILMGTTAEQQIMGTVNMAFLQASAPLDADNDENPWESEFSFLTQENVDTLRYHYTQGLQSGDFSQFNKYFDQIEHQFNEALYQVQNRKIQQIADEEGPWGEILAGANAVTTKLLSPLAFFDTAAAGAKGERVDTSSPLQLLARSSSDYAQIAGSTSEGFGKFLVDTAISIAGNAPSIALAMAGMPGVGAVLSALQAAGTDAAQQNLLGATPWQAVGHAAVIGAVEYFSSKIPFQTLSNVVSGTGMVTKVVNSIAPKRALVNVLLKGVSQAGLEFTEEAATSLISNVADMIVGGDRSAFAQQVQENLANGMTEAEARNAAATQLFVIDPLYEGAIGAVSGGISGATAGAINAARAGAYTGNLKTTSARLGGIIASSESSTDTQVYVQMKAEVDAEIARIDQLRTKADAGGKDVVMDKSGELRVGESESTAPTQQQTQAWAEANPTLAKQTIVDGYSALLDIPESALPNADFQPLQQAYRSFEASPTAENASAVLLGMNASIDIALASGQLDADSQAQLISVKAEIDAYANKDAGAIADNVVEWSDSRDSIDGIRIIDGKVGGKIPVNEFIDLRQKSIKNIDADTMTLGRYSDGSDSYIAKAGGNSSYFDLGDEWSIIQAKYSLSDQEMFEYFNKPAINDAIESGKGIRFSHDPSIDQDSYLYWEWDYIKKALGVDDGNLIQSGGFWYVK